jgi:hypothetical protein
MSYILVKVAQLIRIAELAVALMHGAYEMQGHRGRSTAFNMGSFIAAATAKA